MTQMGWTKLFSTCKNPKPSPCSSSLIIWVTDFNCRSDFSMAALLKQTTIFQFLFCILFILLSQLPICLSNLHSLVSPSPKYHHLSRFRDLWWISGTTRWTALWLLPITASATTFGEKYVLSLVYMQIMHIIMHIRNADKPGQML